MGTEERADAVTPSAPPTPEVTAPAPPLASPPRRRRLGLELTVIAVVGVIALGAFAAGASVLYRELYSPSAFVLRYLDLLAEGRAADALAVPGVAVDSAALEDAGLSPTASTALLRSDALGDLSDVRVVSEVPGDDATRVTVAYRAGAHDGETTFDVAQDGWLGVVPAWRFERSPLAVMDLVVRGSMRFAVNDFEVDKRQVSIDGVDADPMAAVPLLIFSPGVYSVDVDTPISATPGAAVLADSPFVSIPVDMQATATTEFIDVVQGKVEEFLAACATQQVLQPTGCPFGFSVQNRVVGLPSWSISEQPTVTVLPDGAGWKIPTAEAVARIDVDIRSLFDGSVRTVSEDVPFFVNGTIEVLPDGSVSIKVSGSEGE
ncbi:hypothetical protein [Microbacterium sp. P05]|uniref:hypothetical protein n=1 Tax=Microbacterium sp. P05 TaxID=3366948 RepID=UPI0037450570